MAEHAADSDRGAAERPSSPGQGQGDASGAARLGSTLRSEGAPELLEAQRMLQADAAAADLDVEVDVDVTESGSDERAVPRPPSKGPPPPPAMRSKPSDSSVAELPDAASARRPLPPPRTKRDDEGNDSPNGDRTPDTPTITSSPGALLGDAEAEMLEQELELEEASVDEEPSDAGESAPERLSDADLLESEEELLESEEELLESEEELLEYEAEADRAQEARAPHRASEPEQELGDEDLEEADEEPERGAPPAASGPPDIPALSSPRTESDSAKPEADVDAAPKDAAKRRPRSTLRIPDDAIPATPAPPPVSPTSASRPATDGADDAAETDNPATTGAWTQAPSKTLRPAAAAPPGPPPPRSPDSPRPPAVEADAEASAAAPVTKSGTLIMASVPEPAAGTAAPPRPDAPTPMPPGEIATAEFIAVEEDEEDDDEDGRPTTLPEQPRRPAAPSGGPADDHQARTRSEPPQAQAPTDGTPSPTTATTVTESEAEELEEIEAEPLSDDSAIERAEPADAKAVRHTAEPEATKERAVSAPPTSPDVKGPTSPSSPPPAAAEPAGADAEVSRVPRPGPTEKPHVRTSDEAPVSQPPPVSSRPSAPSGVVADAHSVGLILPVFVSSDLPPVESQRGRRIAPPRRVGRDGEEVSGLEELEPEAEITVPDGKLPRPEVPPPEAAPTTEPSSSTSRRPLPPPRNLGGEGAGIDVDVDVDAAEAGRAAVPAPPPVPPSPAFEAAPEAAPTPEKAPAAEAKPASDVKPPTAPKAPKRKKPWWSELFEEDFEKTHDPPVEKDVLREADFIERVLNLAKGARVLDLGCGLGRHAAELASRGYEVVGVDHSNMMLAKATDHAAARGVTVNLVKGDMRKLNLDAVFDGIYCWSQTFGYFDEQTNHAVLESIHRALRQGGTFALDVSNRDFIAPRSPTMVWFERPGCVCMDEMKFDFYTSRMIVKRTVLFETGRSREIEFSMRLYSLHEIGRLLHSCGFRVLEVSGHRAHPGTYFGSESPRIIVAAERT